LTDLSVASREAQEEATGTHDKPVDTGKYPREKLTPRLTPTAYPECNRSATIGNQEPKIEGIIKNDNCLLNSDLGSRTDHVSSAVTEESKTRPAGLEPATFGFEVLNGRL